MSHELRTTLENAWEYSWNGLDGGAQGEWQRKQYCWAGGDIVLYWATQYKLLSGIHIWVQSVWDIPNGGKYGCSSVMPSSIKSISKKKIVSLVSRLYGHAV